MRVKFALCVCACVSAGIAGCSREAAPERNAPVELARSALVALGPEIGTDAPVLIQEEVGYNPALGSDGSGFLSVMTASGGLRAIRVDGSGRVLDPFWLSFGASPEQYYPHVAFGGGQYLVTWTEADREADPNNPGEQIPDSVRGRFVSPDGTSSGDASFVISSGDGLYSAAAWNGTHFVVAWLRLAEQGTNVYTALLDATGAKVAGSERAVTTNSKAGEPRVAANGEQAFVVWYDYSVSTESESRSVIRGARLGSDGAVKDPGGVALSSGDTYDASVAVASDGSGFLAVWQAGSGAPSVVRGSLVRADGSVAVRDFAIPSGTGSTGLPSVTFDGARYLVAWADERDNASVYGVHVSTSGVVGSDEARLASGSPRSVSSGSDRTSVAFNGTKYLVSFLGKGIEGALVEPDLDVEVGSIGLSALPNAQSYPQTSWNGENYLVTFSNELEEVDHARAVRISGEGVILDAVSLAISGDADAYAASNASAAQGSALVSWTNYDDTSPTQWLRTVSSAGALGAPIQFPPAQRSSGVALASSGSGYLAVADDSASGKVEGYLVDAAGAVGTKFDIGSSMFNRGSVPFAAGDGYLVSYGGPGTQLAPVSAQGVVGTPIQLSAELSRVSVATNGEHSLVVWSPGVGGAVIRAQRFENGALVGSPFTLTEESAGYGAAVAWDGTTYWTAWDVEGYTIEGRPVAADGTLGDVVQLASAEASGPTFASDGAGQLLLSYIRWYEHALTRRVTSRLVGRDAGELPVAGAGGSSSGGSSSGGSSSGGSSSGETSESGGGGNAGAAGSISPGTAGTSSSSGGAAGGASTAGSAGSAGGSDRSSCSVSPARGSGGSSAPAWLASAALILCLLRRRERG